MTGTNRVRGTLIVTSFMASACLFFLFGCGVGSTDGFLSLFGNPITDAAAVPPGTGGPGGVGTGNNPAGGGNDRTNVDPCTETQSRKFVRISLRNTNPDDFVHYFLVLVAFVSSEQFPDGAVCPADIPLYTAAGYTEIPAGGVREFGNFCFVGPALVYFHEGGQFRRPGGAGGSTLASAIAPSQGTQASFDGFFTAAGAQIPVPNLIIFHNPGTGDGANLKISRNSNAPCDLLQLSGQRPCQQDAFYYVDELDLMAGSTQLGTGSGRRVPSEIQDTSCQCQGYEQPWHALAPSRVTANGALCNEFLRGGRIEYAFLRNDTNPSFPQLVWRVTDSAGAIVHDFDSRSGVR